MRAKGASARTEVAPIAAAVATVTICPVGSMNWWPTFNATVRAETARVVVAVPPVSPLVRVRFWKAVHVAVPSDVTAPALPIAHSCVAPEARSLNS
jgi:hypothetical protein